MAPNRTPGPLSTTDRTVHIDDGTMPRSETARPGPIGHRGKRGPLYETGPSNPMPMMFLEFRKSGPAVTNPAVTLGVMPEGELKNAMEIGFREGEEAARRRKTLSGYCTYRVRQTLEEHDWQFVNGQWSPWTDKPAGTPDDPDPAPSQQSWTPPDLRMYDTPGWTVYQGVTPTTRQLIANGVKSDPNATEIWLQQVFNTWAQGEDCFTGVWSDVSIKIIWHNSLHLVRDTPVSPWRAGKDCRIQHGPMAFGSAQQL